MPTPGLLNAAAGVADQNQWDPTSDPLVERNSVTGQLRPAGHPFNADGSPGPGLNSYGLTDPEMVAFQFAVARVSGNPAPLGEYRTLAESIAIRDAGLGPHTDSNSVLVAGATDAQKRDFIAQLEQTNPLPTSYFSPPVYDPLSIVSKEAANAPIPAGIINPLGPASINRTPPAGSVASGGTNAAEGADPLGATPDSWKPGTILLFLAIAGVGLLAVRQLKR